MKKETKYKIRRQIAKVRQSVDEAKQAPLMLKAGKAEIAVSDAVYCIELMAVGMGVYSDD